MIAVQHIAIHWTKWERGADDGAKRNALPRRLPFAPPGDPTADWVHHAHFRSDRDGEYGFEESWTQRRPEARDAVLVHPRGDVAEVVFDPAGAYQGKLHRPHFTGLIARLPLGHRLLVRLNGASDGDHQRYYHEYAIHVGYAATATLELPLFREIDERELLY